MAVPMRTRAVSYTHLPVGGICKKGEQHGKRSSYRPVRSVSGIFAAQDHGTVLPFFTGCVQLFRAERNGCLLYTSGYGASGTLVLDPMFEEHFTNVKNAGLKVGVYFFSQATTEEEAKEEAFACAYVLNGRKLDYPIFFDTEDVYKRQTARRSDWSRRCLPPGSAPSIFPRSCPCSVQDPCRSAAPPR